MITHIRWQLLIILLGMILLGTLLGYLAFTFSTVVVPDVGGTYVEGLAGAPRHVNPILCQYNEVDRDLCSLIFNGLTKFNERGEVVHDLAAEWEVSDDGCTYTFHLRRDVEWHDGTPFTADDVIFTVKAMSDPDYQGPPHLAELWRTIRAEKVDAYTVRFILEEPFTPFLDYTTVGILPAHLLAKVPAKSLPQDPFNLRPIGTGPFQVEEINAQHAVLKANPHFYGPKPYLAEIEFRFYPSHEGVFSAYERGEVEGIGRVLPKYLAQVRANEELNLFSARLAGYTLIFLNMDNPNVPFFREKEVRQALLYALDRQKLIDQVLDGQGLVAHSPIMPETWAYYEGIKRYPHNPERAKALLEEAGWRIPSKSSKVTTTERGIREKAGTELKFTLLTSDDPVRVKLAQEIVRQWETVGVRAVLQTMGAGQVRGVLHRRRFDALLIDLELPGDPDPYPFWHSTQRRSGGLNYAGFDNLEADKVLEEARQITDRTRRAELYRRFQEIFAEEVPSLLLYYPIYNYAVDKRVHGVQLAPLNYPCDRFRNISQWYVATKRVIVSQARGED